MYMIRCATVAGLAFGFAISAAAQSVNKCTLSDGRTVFTDKPCGSSDKAERVKAQGNAIDGSGEVMRREIARQSAERMRAEEEAAMANQARETMAPANGGGGTGAGQAGPGCEDARDAYRSMYRRQHPSNRTNAKLSMTPEAMDVRAKCGGDIVPATRPMPAPLPPNNPPMRPCDPRYKQDTGCVK